MTAPRATSEALNSPVMSAERRALTKARAALLAVRNNTIDRQIREGTELPQCIHARLLGWGVCGECMRVFADRAIADLDALVPDAGEPGQ